MHAGLLHIGIQLAVFKFEHVGWQVLSPQFEKIWFGPGHVGAEIM